MRISATYEIVTPPPVTRLDLPLDLRVRVQNTGTATWTNRGMHPVNLSYHWLDAHGALVDFEGLRATLDAPVPPGGSAELALHIEPPAEAGSYQLALDLVEEGLGWFSVQGVPPLLLPLTIAPVPTNVLRACIVNGNCVANDSIGNHIINQMRVLQARGYYTLALVEHVDARLPADVRPFIVQVTLDDLRGGAHNPQTRRAVAHFQNADLYIFQYSTFYPLAEAIRLVSHGVLIFDYHGVTPPQLWEGPGIENLIAGQRRRDLVAYADYAIAHSETMRQELIATGLVAPERVFVNPLLIPLERFQPAPRCAALLARYGLHDEQPVLLYVGRMSGNKRIPDLVRALALVRARLPDAVLLLVGDDQAPPYARVIAECRALAAALGIAAALIVAGQVPDAELPDHYRLASVYVTASLHEGFGIPVIEAMACGVPVVGAHAAALPEAIGSAGLTFRPQDAADLAARVLEVLEDRSQEPGARSQESGVRSQESGVRSQEPGGNRAGATL